MNLSTLAKALRGMTETHAGISFNLSLAHMGSVFDVRSDGDLDGEAEAFIHNGCRAGAGVLWPHMKPARPN